MRRAAWILLVVGLGLVPAPTARAAHADPMHDALAYLAAHADANVPKYAALGLDGAGIDPATWPSPDGDVLDQLPPPDGSTSSAYDSTLYETVAIAASGRDPSTFRGHDYVATVRAGFQGAQFGDPTTINDDAWAILALRAAGVPANDSQIQSAALVILNARTPDNGWSYSTTSLHSSPDMTGMALAALAASGRNVRGDASASSLAGYYHADSGAYSSDSQTVNVQSTIWALHALALLGAPAHPESTAYILAQQQDDGGFPAYQGGPSNAYATDEALLWLAGTHYPVPGYQSGSARSSAQPAGQPTLLWVEGPFTAASWSTDEGGVVGVRTSFTFHAAGRHTASVYAQGPGGVLRASLVLDVPHPKAIATLAASEFSTFRFAAVPLDASGSRDPDGQVASFRVDWGDGNATQQPGPRMSHAYALPGNYQGSLVAVGSAGGASDAAPFLVHVLDRAPIFGPLPAIVLADRATDATLATSATDPDGDNVTLAWSTDNASGTGTFRHRFDGLGNHTVALRATDPFGASAWANVTVAVVNLAPTLDEVALPANATAGQPFAYSAVASDADGPPPTIRWTFANATREGAQGTITLPAGETRVLVEARDADGAVVRAERVVVVVETPPTQANAAPSANATKAEPAPRIADFHASLEAGVLRVAANVSPSGAVAIVSWSSDVGNGSAPLVEGRMDRAIPSATNVSLTLHVAAGGIVATQDAGPFYIAAPSAPLAPPIFVLGASAISGRDVPLDIRLPANGTEARVDFGDGNVSAWSDETRLHHVWAQPGAYDLRVEARATDGRTASADMAVMILAPPSLPAPIHDETRGVSASPTLTPWVAQPVREAPGPPAAWMMASLVVLAAGLRARGRMGRR